MDGFADLRAFLVAMQVEIASETAWPCDLQVRHRGGATVCATVCRRLVKKSGAAPEPSSGTASSGASRGNPSSGTGGRGAGDSGREREASGPCASRSKASLKMRRLASSSAFRRFQSSKASSRPVAWRAARVRGEKQHQTDHDDVMGKGAAPHLVAPHNEMQERPVSFTFRQLSRL